MVDLLTSTVDEVCTEIMRAGWEVDYPPQPFTLNITGTTISVQNQVGDTVALNDSWRKPGSVIKTMFSMADGVERDGIRDGTRVDGVTNSLACDTAFIFFANRIADRYLGMIRALGPAGTDPRAEIEILEYRVRSNPSDPNYRAIRFKLSFSFPQRGTAAVTGDAISLVENGIRDIYIEGEIGDPGAAPGQTKIGEMRLTDKMVGSENDPMEIGTYEDRVLNFSMGNNPSVLAIIEKFAGGIEQLKAQWEAKRAQPAEPAPKKK